MKKEICFLVMFLAILATVSHSYGQALPGAIPRPLSCPNDALHPVAGKEYTYSVTTTPTGGVYTWWVTKNPDFITTNVTTGLTTTNDSTQLVVDPAQLISKTGETTKDLKIKWSSSILAGTSYQGADVTKSPTFVVVKYTPPSTSGCADNLKVYELDPKTGFTVDIINLDNETKDLKNTTTPYDQAEDQCFANLFSATYNNTNHKMDYDYGTNILYYEVVAANFTGSWTPTFKLTGLDPKQKPTIEWSYKNDFPTGSTYTVTSETPSTESVKTTEPNTYDGVAIYVRVTIKNNNYEGLGNEPITLAVDGTNAAGELDAVNSTCKIPAAADFVDVATQTLKLRPTIGAGTTSATSPNTTLIPQN